VDWIDLAQDRNKWLAVAKAAIKFRDFTKYEIFLVPAFEEGLCSKTLVRQLVTGK